jgi:RecA-family ATPase
MFVLGEPKKAMKSWLLFNLGWDLSEGRNIWGVKHTKNGEVFVPARPMRVLYFTQEDTEDDLQDRFKLMVAAGRVPNENFYYQTKDLNFAFDGESGEKRIHEAIKTCAPIDLVMFDPMRRIHYFDENDSQAIAKFWKSLNDLEAKFNCSAIFSHHLTKPSKDGASRESPHAARGSGDIFGGADTFINVVPKPKQGQTRRSYQKSLALHFETKRSAPLEPIGLTVDLVTGLVNFDCFNPGLKGEND